MNPPLPLTIQIGNNINNDKFDTGKKIFTLFEEGT